MQFSFINFRLFADILNDAAICTEMIAPFFKDYFTGIVCVAGVMKVCTVGVITIPTC